MVSNEAQRQRDWAQEERERRRYEVLERMYLLAGTDCQCSVDAAQIEREFGPQWGPEDDVLAELAALGLLTRGDSEDRYRLTPRAVGYLQSGAWRRRSIRDL